MAVRKLEIRRYWLGGKRKAEQDLFFQQALKSSLWQQGDQQDWDACWFTGMPAPEVFRRASATRKINHIPGNSALTLKSSLYRTVASLRERLVEQYGAASAEVARLGFLPCVYSMPEDYHQLQEDALDDPSRHWILKPANASRGRGIRVLTDVATAPVDAPWMVQQYLEKPHTMHKRKYVLRLYVLIASIEPLRVYLYRQGFAKLASEPYDVNDADNVYSQLTNPDINALNSKAQAPVEFVDLDRYRQWLREEGHDDKKLFERIHDLVTLTMIAALEPMRKRSAECKADPRGCYELLGLDCLVDADLKPWILECNLSPSLGICAAPEDGGEIEEQIKSALVADMTSIVGLNLTQPAGTENTIEDLATQIAAQAQQELEQAGGFQRLYPNADVDDYLPFFAMPRLTDILLADAVKGSAVRRPRLQRRFATELVTEEKLALYHEKTGQLINMNDSAAFIWLMAMEGIEPDAIAEHLFAASQDNQGNGPDLLSVRKDVWDSLADWAHRGLLMQAATSNHSVVISASREVLAPLLTSLACGARGVRLQTDSRPVIARLEPLIEALGCDQAVPLNPLHVEILRDTSGFALAIDGEVIATRLPLSMLALRLPALLARHTARSDQLVLDVALLASPTAVMMFARPEGDDGFICHFTEKHGYGFSRALSLDREKPASAQVIGLPGQNGNHLFKPTPGLTGPEQISAIVVPVTSKQTGGILQPIPVTEALEALLPACSLAAGHTLTGTDFTALAAWVSERECFTLNVADYAAAQEALIDKLGS